MIPYAALGRPHLYGYYGRSLISVQLGRPVQAASRGRRAQAPAAGGPFTRRASAARSAAAGWPPPAGRGSGFVAAGGREEARYRSGARERRPRTDDRPRFVPPCSAPNNRAAGKAPGRRGAGTATPACCQTPASAATSCALAVKRLAAGAAPDYAPQPAAGGIRPPESCSRRQRGWRAAGRQGRAGGAGCTRVSGRVQ